MPLPKEFIVLNPKGVDQRTEPQLLGAGKMLALTNVRQPSPGLFRKRQAFTAMDRNADVGSVTTGRGLASTGDALVLRTKDDVRVRSNDEAAWVRKMQLPVVGAEPVADVMPYGYKPSTVRYGAGVRYYFSADQGQNSAAPVAIPNIGNGVVLQNTPSWWYYRVVDDVTGAELQPLTKIATVQGWHGVPVLAGGFVWFFVGATGNKIYALKFDPTMPRNQPTRTTYYDAGAGVIEGFDAFAINNNADAVVAIGGAALPATAGTNPARLVLSLLDMATGLPKVAPGVVGVVLANPIASQISIQFARNKDGANGFVYLLTIGGGMASVILKLDAAALTISLTTTPAFGVQPTVGTFYVDGDGTYVTFTAVPGTDPAHAHLSRIKFATDGSTGGVDAVTHGMYPVSFPFLIDGQWFLIAGSDDNLGHQQAAYFLMRDPGAALGTPLPICGRALYGLGGDVGQRATFIAGANDLGYIGPALVIGKTVVMAVNAWADSQYVAKEIGFTMDAKLGPLVAAVQGEEVTIPGAWPVHLAGEAVIEFLPEFPRAAATVTVIAGVPGSSLPLGDYTVTYLWMYRDSAGNVHRSAPSPPSVPVTIAVANKSLRIIVDTLTRTNARPGDIQIELYIERVVPATGARTNPDLQFALANDPTDPNMSATIDLEQADLIHFATLYTFGDAQLPNDAAPPFRACFAWRNRLFAVDTDVEGDIWVSKEKVSGEGFSFSAVLAFSIAEAGRIYGGGGIDFNYAALFGALGIWVISGVGPDSARGSGQYEPMRLPGTLGCTNPRSIVTTPSGIEFDGTDGRRWLLTRSLQLVDVGAGVESYRSRVAGAAVFEPNEQQARVHLEPP